MQKVETLSGLLNSGLLIVNRQFRIMFPRVLVYGPIRSVGGGEIKDSICFELNPRKVFSILHTGRDNKPQLVVDPEKYKYVFPAATKTEMKEGLLGFESPDGDEVTIDFR